LTIAPQHASCASLLADFHHLGRLVGEPLHHLLRCGLQLRIGHPAIHQPEPLGFCGGQRVSGQADLEGTGAAQDARQVHQVVGRLDAAVDGGQAARRRLRGRDHVAHVGHGAARLAGSTTGSSSCALLELERENFVAAVPRKR
jgi:hypothetical protein